MLEQGGRGSRVSDSAGIDCKEKRDFGHKCHVLVADVWLNGLQTSDDEKLINCRSLFFCLLSTWRIFSNHAVISSTVKSVFFSAFLVSISDH